MRELIECSAPRRLAKNPAEASVVRTGISCVGRVQGGTAAASCDAVSAAHAREQSRSRGRYIRGRGRSYTPSLRVPLGSTLGQSKTINLAITQRCCARCEDVCVCEVR